MISYKFKLWSSVGAALVLSACGQSVPPEAPKPVVSDAGGEAGEAANGEGGEAGAASAYAGAVGDQLTALRLQHLKGFLLIAERIADGDRPADAGVLVAQGLLEVYDPRSDQFGALDVTQVRAAADGANLSRPQMAQRLQAGERAIDQARGQLSGVDHADLAVRMVDLSTGLYQNVTVDGGVDPIEYQHSLGAALAAREALTSGEAGLRRRDAAAYTEGLAELNRMIALWPQNEAPEQPASYQDVLRQSSRVRLALSPFL